MPSLNLAIPIIILVPVYGYFGKNCTLAITTTIALIIALLFNSVWVLKCRNRITKILLIILGVFIAYQNSIIVSPCPWEIIKCEEKMLITATGIAKGDEGLVKIGAKITKTSEYKKHLLKENIILNLERVNNFRYDSSKLEVKGVLYTNEKDQLTIFVYKLKEKLYFNIFEKFFRDLHDRYICKIKNYSKLKKDTQSFLIALTTGNKESFENNNKNLFIRTGTIHLFAVSGLHFGILYLIFKLILNVLIKVNTIRSIIVIIILYLYLIFINEPISATRAFLMLAFWEINSLSRKKTSGLSSIALAFIFSYITNPLSIFSVSFQLSFTIVLVIIWFFNERFENNINKTLGLFTKPFTASLASFSGSFLILLASFNQFVPIAIISNILLVPLAFPIMIVCIIYCFFFFVFNIDLYFILNSSYELIFLILKIFDTNYFYDKISVTITKISYVLLPIIVVFLFNINLKPIYKFFIIILIQVLFITFSIQFLN